MILDESESCFIGQRIVQFVVTSDLMPHQVVVGGGIVRQ